MKRALTAKHDTPRAPRAPFGWCVAHCLGFGACWGWVHTSFFSSLFWDEASAAGLYAWLWNLLANGLTMVAVGLAARRRGRGIAGSRAALVGFPALVGAGTVCSAGIVAGMPLLSDVLGPLFTGVGTAGMLILWAEAYGRIDADVARKYTLPASMLAAIGWYLLVMALPHAAAVAVTVALPTVSVACMWATSRCVPAAVAPQGEKGTGRMAPPPSQMRLLARFFLVVAVYCLPAGFIHGQAILHGYSEGALAGGAVPFGSAMFGGVAVILILAVVVSLVAVRREASGLTYRMIIPLMAAGLLLLPFVGEAGSIMANVAIMGGYVILEMFVWSTLQDIARGALEPTATVYGLGKSGMNLGLFAGTVLGVFAASYSTMIVVGVAVAIVYGFILMGALMPKGAEMPVLPQVEKGVGETSVDVGAQAGPAAGCTGAWGCGARVDAGTADAGAVRAAAVLPAEGVDPNAVVEEALRRRCHAMGERYGLSAREEEVLNLLVRGRSVNAAADALGVAASTVKSHKDRIYQKCGVHTKQELLDLAETP